LVEFKETVNDQLLMFDDVCKVEQLQTSHFKLHTGHPESVRKKIVEFSLLQNLNIISLQTESKSLEEVFRQLTTN